MLRGWLFLVGFFFLVVKNIYMHVIANEGRALKALLKSPNESHAFKMNHHQTELPFPRLATGCQPFSV